MASGSVVADIELSGASCRIGVSDSIPVLLPPLPDRFSYGSGQNAGERVGWEWTLPATEVDKVPVGFADVMALRVKARIRALSSRSVSILGLYGRPRCRQRPGRLTPKVGAGDHPGQDAQPAPHSLLPFGGVRRSSAVS